MKGVAKALFSDRNFLRFDGFFFLKAFLFQSSSLVDSERISNQSRSSFSIRILSVALMCKGQTVDIFPLGSSGESVNHKRDRLENLDSKFASPKVAEAPALPEGFCNNVETSGDFNTVL